MIKIDGVRIPTPSSYLVGIYDISHAERNARGNMIIERVATKQKIELEYKHLSRAQLQQVLQAVAPVFFTAEYEEPLTGEKRTGTFYCGDRTIGALDFLQGQIRWKDIKFNLIER